MIPHRVLLAASLAVSPCLAQDSPQPRVTAAVAVTAPSDPTEALRAQHLAGRSLDASGQAFDVGGGRYAFASGTFWEIAAKDGKPVGFFFEGQGKLAWAAEDAAAAKVYADNAKRLGGFDVLPDKSLVASFSRGSFYFSDEARPALKGAFAPAEGPAAAFEKHRERLRPDRAAPPEIGLAAARAASGRYFAALLEGSRDIRHVLDDVNEVVGVSVRAEGVPIGFVNWRFFIEIGKRPVGRARRVPPPLDFRLVDVDVDVRETTDDRGTLAVEETIVPEHPIRAAGFQLVSEYLMSRGLSTKPTRMLSVTDAEGKPLGYAFDKNVVFVFFPEPLAPKVPKKIRFSYDAGYFERVGGDNYWELPLAGGWYPQPLSLRSAVHGFHATIRAKKPFVPFASGDTIRRGDDGAWNLVETRLSRPATFAGALAGKYTVQEETRDGVTCRVASYGVSKEKSGAKLTNLFHKIRKFYEPYFGPFPWKEYDIVEINSFGFGQAPPGMMRITQEAFQANVYGDPWGELFSQGINERLAHEIAHAYWGYVVWGADSEDQWIEEAFAEASAARAIEVLKDKAEYDRLVTVWRDRAKDSAKSATIPTANEISQRPSVQPDFDLYRDRIYLLYCKGPTLLTALRKELGDDTFYTVLKSFLRSFEKKPAVTTDQFIGLLSYVTKKDWKPWFEKYYYGFEMP